MKKIWVKKLKSFKSATEPDIDYYLSMSPTVKGGQGFTLDIIYPSEKYQKVRHYFLTIDIVNDRHVP